MLAVVQEKALTQITPQAEAVVVVTLTMLDPLIQAAAVAVIPIQVAQA
jgi:hypothetical protein